MRAAIATVLVALSLVLAGCPGTDGDGGPAVQQNDTDTPDNDAGVEPVNPQNGTDAAGTGTEDPQEGLTPTANATATPSGGGE